MTHVAGGVAITLDGDITTSPDAIFARGSEPPAITIRLSAERARGPLRPAGAPTIEQDSWVVFADDDRIQICVKDSRRDPREAMRIELPREGLVGRYLYDHDHGWPYAFQHPIDQLLIIHALGVAGGALMHAASIAGRDGALLVAGPSGAGKTTMSRAAAALGADVMGDERTVVRPAESGGWLACGTPWPGEGGFTASHSVPLRALILLEQAERNELIPLSPARALALLCRCHLPPWWDARARARTLDSLERLVRDLPAFVYRNQKSPEAARHLLAQVGGVA